MKQLVIPFCLVLALAGEGCKTVDKDALAAWQASEVSLMQDLKDYRAAWPHPTTDIDVHLATPFEELTVNEETALMAETLSFIQNDDRRSEGRKQTYALKIQAHLNLFHSLKGD